MDTENQPARDRDGDDVSDESAETLHRRDARYRAMIDHVHDAIIVISADGCVVEVNRAAQRLFGYAATDIIGQPVTRLVPERYRIRHAQAVLRYLTTGVGSILERPIEVVGLHHDGTECPLELTVILLPEKDGPLFAGILRDLSERQQVDAERAQVVAAAREEARRLRELATLKADFSAMVAHELGAPLGAIRRIADVLATGTLGADAQASLIAILQEEARTLAALVAEVRTAATVERDDFAVELRPVALRAMLAPVIAVAATLPGRHPLTVPPIPDVSVRADPNRIAQVLRNLLGNAARYAPEETPMTLRAMQEGLHVRIEVADQGPGIHPDDQARIFEKFGRGRDAAGRHVAGAGLGLYLSRRIIQAHGSTLSVDSTYGVGSVFGFTLEVVS